MTIKEMVALWKESNIKLNQGATDEEILELESKLDFIFPDSFKNLYKMVNGFKDWDTTENLFSIWPLERILNEYTEYDDKNFIPFCDYLINIYQIGFLRDKQGIYKSYNEEIIASTFEEAITLIQSDSDLIY